MDDSKNISKKQQRTIMDFFFILADLTTKNGYSKLSVSEIVAHSGYNRATFYKYFKNKDDLAATFLEYICHDFYEACCYPFKEKKEINFKRMKPKDLIIFSHILKHTEFYNLIVLEDTLPKLQSSIIKVIVSILNHELIFNFEGGQSTFNSNAIYKAYGFYGLLHEWIISDYQIPPTRLSHDIITILANDSSKADIRI